MQISRHHLFTRMSDSHGLWLVSLDSVDIADVPPQAVLARLSVVSISREPESAVLHVLRADWERRVASVQSSPACSRSVPRES